MAAQHVGQMWTSGLRSVTGKAKSGPSFTAPLTDLTACTCSRFEAAVSGIPTGPLS